MEDKNILTITLEIPSHSVSLKEYAESLVYLEKFLRKNFSDEFDNFQIEAIEKGSFKTVLNFLKKHKKLASGVLGLLGGSAAGSIMLLSNLHNSFNSNISNSQIGDNNSKIEHNIVNNNYYNNSYYNFDSISKDPNLKKFSKSINDILPDGSSVKFEAEGEKYFRISKDILKYINEKDSKENHTETEIQNLSVKIESSFTKNSKKWEAEYWGGEISFSMEDKDFIDKLKQLDTKNNIFKDKIEIEFNITIEYDKDGEVVDRKYKAVKVMTDIFKENTLLNYNNNNDNK